MWNIEWKFWMAVAVGAVLKIILSKRLSPMQVVVSLISAFAIAWVGTDPLIAYFGLDPARDQKLVAVALALSGEHIARYFVDGSALEFLKSKLTGVTKKND